MLKKRSGDDSGVAMKTYKSIADEVLRKKVDAEDRADAERAENVQVDEKIKAIVEKKLAEKLAEKEAELKAEKEAEKSSGFSGPFTTEPMEESGKKVKARQPALEEHYVEPVVPVKEKPPVHDKPIVEGKPVEKNPPVEKRKLAPVERRKVESVERRRFNLMPPFSPLEKRRSR